MIGMLENIDPVVQGAGGVGIVGIGGRLLLSWWRKQNDADKSIDRNDAYIKRIEDEAKKWEARHAELMAQHEEHQELITLLKVQNTMMRQLLISKGMTEAELAAIGALHHD